MDSPIDDDGTVYAMAPPEPPSVHSSRLGRRTAARLCSMQLSSRPTKLAFPCDGVDAARGNNAARPHAASERSA